MWEVTLIGESQDYVHFHIFEKMLKSTYNKQVIIAISPKVDTACLSVAVTNKRLISPIKKLLLELIIKICKEEYYIANLNILTEDDELRYFVLLTAVISNLEDEVEVFAAFTLVQIFDIFQNRSGNAFKTAGAVGF